MTIGEFERILESKRRTQKREAQEKAYFDYTLADLIGYSIARIFNSSNEYPQIYEAYPSYFKEEEVEEAKQKKILELSALRLTEFTKSFNKKKKLKEDKNE